MQQRALGMSLLGFGCMRFPRKNGHIDKEATEKLIVKAVNGGITYFDTAYIYTGSEDALGEILEKNALRDRVLIATKIPHYLIKDLDGLEKIFQTSLNRLRTDHVDNLLMHMLPDVNIRRRLADMGVDKWIEEKKAAGEITHIGFSFHGSADEFIKLLDDYPWDFCQCQYNYMDENSQAGRRGIEHAYALGVPVIIMEPLRGGRLTDSLPAGARELFANTTPSWKKTGASDAKTGNSALKATPAEWGLDWLYDQKEITTVLSGMNTMEMLAENIAIAENSHVGMYGDEDRAVISRVKEIIDARVKVPCTGCGYCMPCPFGVDIPGCFRAYNNRYADGWFSSLKEYFMTTAMRSEKSYASLCRSCGRCEKLCPQHIPVREKLKEAASHLEGLPFKAATFVTKHMFKG